MSGSHRRVCAAVRDWQQGDASVDDVTALALAETGGDEGEARRLMRAAVEWWVGLAQYRDVNGVSNTWRAA